MSKFATNCRRSRPCYPKSASSATLVAAALLLLAAPTCSASPMTVPVSVQLENYFVTENSGTTLSTSREMTYLIAQAALTPNVSMTVSALNCEGETDLDENYFQLESGDTRFRIGRFRSAFGFSDWSEQYYQGFIELPLARYDNIGPDLSLTRVDSGFEWQQTSGPTQVTMAVIDADSGGYEVLPRSINHADIRVQRLVGSFILGANGLVDTNGSNNVYGLDARWTAPHWQVRAEYDRGSYTHPQPSGYYADVLYHPPGLLRTTFLGRAESAYNLQDDDDDSAFGSEPISGHQYTLGVKQILSRQFTLEFSRFYGDGEAREAPDWALQLITFTRF